MDKIFSAIGIWILLLVSGFRASVALDEDRCVLKATARRDGPEYVDILLQFSRSPESTFGNLWGPNAVLEKDDVVFLVASLEAEQHYRSFVPLRCELTATDEFSTVSLNFAPKQDFVQTTEIVKDYGFVKDEDGHFRRHYFELNPIIFVHMVKRSAAVRASCEFRLCIDISSHQEQCDLTTSVTRQNISVNTGGFTGRSVNVGENRKRKFDRTGETKSEKDESVVSTELAEACLDKSAFIGLTTAIGALLLILVIANITLIVNVLRQRKPFRAGSTTSSMPSRPMRTVVSTNAAPVPENYVPHGQADLDDSVSVLSDESQVMANIMQSVHGMIPRIGLKNTQGRSRPAPIERTLGESTPVARFEYREEDGNSHSV